MHIKAVQNCHSISALFRNALNYITVPYYVFLRVIIRINGNCLRKQILVYFGMVTYLI